MAWMGWKVEAVDWYLGSGMDMLRKEKRQKYLDYTKEYDAVLIATPCGSHTRVRERPIPGHPNPPVPLRDAQNVRGKPGLSESDERFVQEGDILTDFFLNLVNMGHCKEKGRGTCWP